jgi:hypothetical protein
MRSRATVFSSAAVGLCALSECVSPFPLARRHPTSCRRAQEILDALWTMQGMRVQRLPALQPCPPGLGCGWLPSAKCACPSPAHSAQRIAHVTRKSLTGPFRRVAYRTCDALPNTPPPPDRQTPGPWSAVRAAFHPARRWTTSLPRARATRRPPLDWAIRRPPPACQQAFTRGRCTVPTSFNSMRCTGSTNFLLDQQYWQ